MRGHDVFLQRRNTSGQFARVVEVSLMGIGTTEPGSCVRSKSVRSGCSLAQSRGGGFNSN